MGFHLIVQFYGVFFNVVVQFYEGVFGAHVQFHVNGRYGLGTFEADCGMEAPGLLCGDPKSTMIYLASFGQNGYNKTI